MANLIINNLDTITYRTDCFRPNSINKYYIRNHDVKYYSQNEYNDGYEEKIEDVQGTFPDTTTALFDIGCNAYDVRPTNPIIADKLILFGSLKDSYSQSTPYLYDLAYSSLKFEKPLLLINGTEDESYYFQNIKFSVGSRGYCLIDELRVDISYPDVVFYADGKYWAQNVSSPQYYTLTNEKIGKTSEWTLMKVTGDFSDKAGQLEICLDYLNYSQSRNVNRYALGYNGLSDFVCTKDEILSRFVYSGSERPDVFDYITNNLTNGGIMMPGDALIVQRYFNDHCSKYRPYIGQTIGTAEYVKMFNFIIIPFYSEAEYQAAKAVIYKWETSVTNALNS